MGITVREALKIGGLRKAKVIAGFTGIAREIEYVTVLEVPDIIQWLKGKELILTSGYAISKNEEEQVHLIKELAAKGTGALVIKTQRFLNTIPTAMLDAANQYEFPLIELEQQIPYIEIIRPIMTEIINRETVQVYRQLTEATVAGGDLEKRLSVLAGLLNNPIAIIDKKGNILAESPTPWVDPTLLSDQMKKVGNTSGLITFKDKITYYLFPLVIEGINEGFLTLGEVYGEIEENVLRSAQNSLPLFTLDLLQRKTLKEIEDSFRNDFLEDLLLGHIKSESVAQRRAHFVGLPGVGRYVIVVISYQGKLDQTQEKKIRGKVVEELEAVFLGEGQTILATTESKDMVALINLHETDELRSMLSLLFQRINKFLPHPFSIGIGEIFKNLTEARKSFLEATEALEFGRKAWGEGSCVFFSDLGVNRLLCAIESEEELKKFIPKGLIELVKYDKEHNTDFLKTLECYLKNAGNSKKTAAEMYIHYKTLQYRLERISEITGIDFNSGEHRLEFHLGLKILDILNRRGSC